METQQLQPRYINQKCGLCAGFGSLKYGSIPCRACRTKGIVVVDQFTGLVVEQNNDPKEFTEYEQGLTDGLVDGLGVKK